MKPIYDSPALTIWHPSQHPVSFLMLELVVLGCAGTTFLHALRTRRDGDGSLLFAWLAILVYGLAMEFLSYTFLDAFTHAQFSVMFYRQKLPLYIVAVYPTLIYTGLAIVRRFGFAAWAEPFAVGLVIVALDVPFDILGPIEGWWHWSDHDPNLRFRWLGVPVTSYYWHFCFGGILAALVRGLARRTRKLGPFGVKLLGAPMVVAGTIGLGILSFLPFHGLKRLGVSDGRVVAGLLFIGALIAILAPRQRRAGSDRLLVFVPVSFCLYHLGLAIALGFEARLAIIGAAVLATLAIALDSQRSGAPQPATG